MIRIRESSPLVQTPVILIVNPPSALVPDRQMRNMMTRCSGLDILRYLYGGVFPLMATHRHFLLSHSGSSELHDNEYVASQRNDTFTSLRCQHIMSPSCFTVYVDLAVCLTKFLSVIKYIRIEF